MTGQEAIDLIQARMGNRMALDETYILAELRNAQARLEADPELPWFMDKLATNFSTTANSQTLAVPTDFRRELDLGLFGTAGDGTVREITKGQYRILRSNNNLYALKGFPEFYDLVGSLLYFFPTPDATYDLEFWYAASQAVITVGTENTWLRYYPELIIAEASIEIARFLRDENYLRLSEGHLQRERVRMQTDAIAYREANRSRYHSEAV